MTSHLPASMDEDFCIIRPSLIKQLRSILDQYPDDGQILKELIQNAEDARAKNVCFLYDETQHGTDPTKLAHPELGIHQGPALYAYNDAVFDESDWKGIRMLQDSIKDKDPMKVGRFGLGFKSVFHMTDMPSVLSDKFLGFIDPHEKYFRFEGDNTTGLRYRLSSVGSDLNGALAHQFQPYQGIFGCDRKTFESGLFKGTLFRFPLRQDESDLSKTLYTRKKIKALFDSFERDAHLVLLFLKHVESVELRVKYRDSPIETLFQVRVEDSFKEAVRAMRNAFVAKLSATEWLDQPAEVVYPLQIETVRYENGGVSQKTSHTYIVSEYFAGGRAVSSDLRSLCLEQNLKNIPLVGVAYPVSSLASQRDAQIEDAEIEYEPDGQVFCFLPLPVEERSSTGLPVHVNGYFSISQNRRHLKWPSQGQDFHSDREILWNQCLLRELIPKAYLNLILNLVVLCKERKLGITPEHMAVALPSMLQVEKREKWKVVLEPFYTSILKQDVFYSEVNGGCWVSVANCVFDCLKDSYATCSVVRKVLLNASVHVTKISQHTMLALMAFCTESLEYISPELTRNWCLKRQPSAYSNLSREEKVLLLAYILKDEDFKDLKGIVLLPTADGEFVDFTGSSGSPVYVPTHDHPREVLRDVNHLLIAKDLSDEVMVKINKLAFEGCTQVGFLNKEIVLRLIPTAVPKDWFQRSPVPIRSDDVCTLKWLEALWNYLRQHTPQDLGMLIGCPILVLKSDEGSFEVVPLNIPSTILLDGATGIHLSEEVQRSLRTLGVRVIQEVVPYIQSHAAVLGEFIRVPLPEDIIDCIVTAIKQGGNEAVQRLKSSTTPEEKRALCELLGNTGDQTLHPVHVKVLSTLPLFETIPYGEKLEREFLSVSEVKRGAPIELPDMDINTRLLDLRKDAVRSLAKKLQVEILSQAKFLTDVVFPELAENLEPQKLEKTMNFVMDNLHKLLHEKPDFVTHLQKLPFLATEEGKYVAVTDLFDPEVDLLKDLFHGEHKFPEGKFAASHFLIFLRQLGLKTSQDITAEDVLTSAMKIENQKGCDDNQLIGNLTRKSNAIVACLTENLKLLDSPVHGKFLRNWLMEISWMACVQEKPAIFPDQLDLYRSQNFLSPGHILPNETMPFVGCVSPVSASSDGRSVLKALGQPLLPTVKQVLLQLKKITEVYQAVDKAKYLQLIMPIYAHLEMEDVSQVERSLLEVQLQDWVWHGDGFTSIYNVLSCKSPMDLKPYLFSLPEEAQMFEKMFQEFGVRSTCSPEALVSVLQDIKAAHSNTEQSAAVKARDLQLSVGILNLLKSQLKEVDQFLLKKIVIPVMAENGDDLCLIPVEECTYCDTEWLQQGFQSLVFERAEGIVLIHDDVPNSTAEALNVPTLMSRMLKAEELSVTGFGQFETLTNRIRSLLEDYTDGYSIAKELVQNADDAGASVVKFMYDERSNFDNMMYLLDEGMKECQGPALWAYNDAMFSEQDFENITKLGGATKEKQVDKIGKFGLGFNAVYNITDVPSFISGDHLVIFDPHTTHIGRSIRDRSKPGIKINLLKNQTLIKKLPDQFYPYQNIFDCSIDPSHPKSYDGTLFRFPLRTTRQAASSEISKQPYDKHEMMKLLSVFAKGAETLLLFTQFVSRIEVYHMPPSAKEPSLLFSVEKEKVLTVAPLEINPSIKFDVLKSCTEYFDKMQNPKAEVMKTSMVVEITVEHSESGSSFFDARFSSSKTPWMLSFVFNMAQKLTTLKKQFQFGYCPYGAVAVALTKSGTDYIPNDLISNPERGTLYCHLPLPIHTYLPVHINGSFAIQSNRRHLCEATDDDKSSWKATWNDFMLQCVICPAYYGLFEHLINVNQSTSVSYMAFWPEMSRVLLNLLPLVRAFYNEKFLDLVVVQDGMKSIPFSKAAIFEKSMFSDSANYDTAVEVFKQSGSQHSIVTIPEGILDTLKALKKMDVASPLIFSKKRILVEIFFPNIDALADEIRDRVLIWAFDMAFLPDQPDIRGAIEQTPCIPTTPDGALLKRPMDLIQMNSHAAKLYHNSDSRFVYPKQMRHSKITKLLVELGMKSDPLDWASIIERGHSVEQLFIVNPVDAIERAKLLLKYIDEKLESEKQPNKIWTAEAENEFMYAASSLSEMKILPIASPPRESPLKWKNQDLFQMKMPLVSAAEACLSTEKSLLCSTYPLADADLISINVQKFLGLKKRATLDHVFVQFNSVLNLDPIDIHKNNPEGFKILQTVCDSIYHFLNDECQKEGADDLCSMIHDGFGQQACVLVENKFIKPCDLARDDRENVAPPFLIAVPSSKTEIAFLLTVLGVRDHFEPRDYIRHLQKLKEKYEENPIRGGELRGCMQLLSGLKQSLNREGGANQNISDKYGKIFVPNASGVLMPPEELCFNNCPWLDVAPPANLVHADVTYSMATSLGVRTQIKEILSDHAVGIPFGQNEKLTTSLKRIIKNYPMDHEILKELVQNADDATATEIHFVLDPRTHGYEHVFEDSWKPLQGPALCVYNNRPFTLRDLEGIQRLGEGSKANDPCKTGQYGIGFSSLYHLTDAPSVLTTSKDLGDMLCVFDPHCYYVPNATKSAPGMRYTNLNVLRASFPDVFTGYLEKDFDMNNSTMFRFPLRTKEMAAKSEISQNVVSPEVVNQMFCKFKNEVMHMLLFSNYLETLKVSVIDNQSKMLTTEYAVFSHLNDSDREKREAFRKACLSVGEQLKSGDIAIQDVKQEKVEYTLHIYDGAEVQEKWRVSQVLGFSQRESVPKNIEEAFEKSKLCLLPRGGAACLLERRVKGNLVKTDTPRKVFCNLPMPLQTALPVHINGHFALGLENRQQIWSSTGSDSDFKRSWNELLCKEVISFAYVELLKSIRAQGILSSSEIEQQLVCSQPSLHSALSAFQDFFPKFSTDFTDWNVLVKSVYSVMASTNAPLFPCIREKKVKEMGKTGNENATWSVEWFPLCGQGGRKAFFASAEVAEPEEIQQSSIFDKVKNYFMQGVQPKQKIELKEVLCECGFNILEVNSDLIEHIKKSDIDVDCMSPEGVSIFFQSYSTETPMCNLGTSLPSPLGKTKIKNIDALVEILKYIFPPGSCVADLNKMPLLLTNDGMLRVFDTENPVYVSKYGTHFQECGDLFLHDAIRQALFEKQNLNEEGLPLRDFTLEALNDCLSVKLPKQYHSEDKVLWKKYVSSVCSEHFIKELWTFASSQLECKRYPQEDDDEYNLRLAISNSKIEPIQKWCILPVRINTENFLYQVGRSEEVIDVRNIPHEFHNLRDIIYKLQIPQLDYIVITANSTEVADFLRNFTATCEKPVLILSAVYKAYEDKRNQPLLSPNETQLFLGYFSQNVEALKSSEESVNQLKALPFYKTICGDVISLEKCLVYVLPEGMLTEEMDSWQNKSGTVFLQRKEKLQPLFDFMGCATLTVLEVYCGFIFKHFELLSRHAQMAHLKHLHDAYLKENASGKSVLTQEEKERVFADLRDLSIIEDSDGQLYPASHYYDPDNALFSVMIGNDKLPPRAVGMRQNEWLSILRKLGLKTDVTPELCVEFASQIAHESQKTSASWKSKALCEHLLSPDLKNKNDILNKVSSIKFIAPERANHQLRQLYPQYGDVGAGDSGCLPYVSFKDSYSQKYMDVIWTCAGVLPHWADPEFKRDKQELHKQLGMNDAPSIDLVVHNLKTVCAAASSNDKVDQMALKRCLKSSYEFLQQHGLEDGKPKSAMKNVADVPFVLVGGSEILAKPCCTTMNIQEQDEMRPHLCKIPYEYGDFKGIFMSLGASEWPRPDQYARVLDHFHKITGGGKLVPSEILVVYRAIAGLFESLERSKNDLDVDVDSLSLLAENGCLYQSTKLVFNDAPWLYDRVKAYNLRFLFDLKECGLKGKPEELVSLLPSRHRPEMLSSYVKEVLVEESKKNLFVKGMAEKLQKRIKEKAFQSAVIRLARHQAHKTGQKLTDDVLFSALDNLSTVNVYATDKLVTHLLYKDKHVKKSQMEKKCFVQKILDPSGTTLCNVYVKNDVDLSQELLIPLAEALNSILNGILKESVLFLLPILSCREEEVDVCLDNLNVHSDLSHAVARMPTLPVTGSIVPDEFHPFLRDVQAHCLNPGDYVAVRNDEMFVYGRLLEVLTYGVCLVDVGDGNKKECSLTVLKTLAREEKRTFPNV